ncbi:unnamed protein product [Prunus armeniaca]
MTPTLLDLAAIVNLYPHGVAYSVVNLPKHILEPDYDKPNKNFNKWIKPNFTYIGLSSRAPIAKSAKRSNLWLRLMQTAKQPDLAFPAVDPSLVPELGPTNITFLGDSLLGKSIASLPLPKHHIPGIPTLETKKEELELWASILISRDLPYGLALNKGNHYPCGCKTPDPKFGFTEFLKA